MYFWTILLPRALAPITWGALLLGLIVGSFLNVCIIRIPQGTFWSKSRSACPACGSRIPFWLNIPVVSYLVLRGRAHCCGGKISVQYPLVELLTGILFVIVYWNYPFLAPMGDGFEIEPGDLIRCIHGGLFVSILLVCSVIDIHLRIIPDVISLPMILATPLVIYFHPDLTWQSGLLGVVLGGGSLFAVAWIYWMLRNQVGMGMGDVKLLAGIGGWLGYQAVLPAIFYGSVLGSILGITGMIVSRRLDLGTKIPFGPFLALGALIHLFLGGQLQEFLMFQG
jgi:leader peptidase (prepilin peptidase)/N-methyltransferase